MKKYVANTSHIICLYTETFNQSENSYEFTFSSMLYEQWTNRLICRVMTISY